MDASTSSSSGKNRRRTAGGAGATSSSSSAAAAAAAAANSLQLLLREDALLQECGLAENKPNPDAVAFPYAAALLRGDDVDQDEDEDAAAADGSSSGAGGGAGSNDRPSSLSSLSTKQRATAANQDVERKLALVESLAVKLSRTRPEAVAGHLLRLHGYEIDDGDGDDDVVAGDVGDAGGGDRRGSATTMTLAAIRDRAERLERQGDVLDGVAKRVENSLSRGLTRMETACQRLERVLTLSSTLKSIMRLQFESNKLLNYDLDDTRDLTRAAASAAVLEDLLSQPELQAGIHVVDRMRPQIEKTARQVRQAAASLLQEQYSQPTALSQLGATLQVYYHLGELPDAVWKAVDEAHNKAVAVSRELFNPVTLSNLSEQAKRSTKEARAVQKKLRTIRVEAAQKWSQGMTDVVLQVRNMQRVLCRKTDPARYVSSCVSFFAVV